MPIIACKKIRFQIFNKKALIHIKLNRVGKTINYNLYGIEKCLR
jgi:hypothetical protein